MKTTATRAHYAEAGKQDSLSLWPFVANVKLRNLSLYYSSSNALRQVSTPVCFAFDEPVHARAERCLTSKYSKCCVQYSVLLTEALAYIKDLNAIAAYCIPATARFGTCPVLS